LNSWADAGVFAYLLPALMIFAVVFGILSKSQVLGKNRGVMATISLAVALMALQFDYVSNFFATIFPYTGIGLSILLAALILMGLLGGDEEGSWIKYVWFGIGAIIFLVILFGSIDELNWIVGLGEFDRSWIWIILGIAAVFGLIVWMVKGGGDGSSSSSSKKVKTPPSG
jgi:bacteriorhodopsin